MNYLKVTYRQVATMLASALPVEGEEFGDKVNEYLASIKAMSQESKVALKVAYVFSRKVPREEREDLFQDLALAVLKAKTKDERLAYAIARCDWQNWWRKYMVRQHYSLDTVIEDDTGNPTTMAELLVGEVEFERKMNGKLEAERIWGLLPDKVKPLINKRLIGKALNHTERNTLNYFVRTQGYKLLMA